MYHQEFEMCLSPRYFCFQIKTNIISWQYSSYLTQSLLFPFWNKTSNFYTKKRFFWVFIFVLFRFFKPTVCRVCFLKAIFLSLLHSYLSILNFFDFFFNFFVTGWEFNWMRIQVLPSPKSGIVFVHSPATISSTSSFRNCFDLFFCFLKLLVI